MYPLTPALSRREREHVSPADRFRPIRKITFLLFGLSYCTLEIGSPPGDFKIPFADQTRKSQWQTISFCPEVTDRIHGTGSIP
jgi:hypothetical protein